MRPLSVSQPELVPRFARRGDPTLSIVLLSEGPENTLEEAVLAVSDAAYELAADVVVVRCEGAPGVERVRRMAAQHGVELLFAPTGSTRAEMSDVAMASVHGDMVAIRPDTQVQGAMWLKAFARRLGVVLTGTAEDHPVERSVSTGETTTRSAGSTIRRFEATSEAFF